MTAMLLFALSGCPKKDNAPASTSVTAGDTSVTAGDTSVTAGAVDTQIRGQLGGKAWTGVDAVRATIQRDLSTGFIVADAKGLCDCGGDHALEATRNARELVVGLGVLDTKTGGVNPPTAPGDYPVGSNAAEKGGRWRPTTSATTSAGRMAATPITLRALARSPSLRSPAPWSAPST